MISIDDFSTYASDTVSFCMYYNFLFFFIKPRQRNKVEMSNENTQLYNPQPLGYFTLYKLPNEHLIKVLDYVNVNKLVSRGWQIDNPDPYPWIMEKKYETINSSKYLLYKKEEEGLLWIKNV